jgi:rod shape-determining protein MreC
VLQLLKRYRELILVAVLLLVPLGVFFARAKKPAERSAVDRTVVWATAPIEKAVAWVVTGVLEGWNGYVALRGAHDRARELSRELNLLRVERQQRVQELAEAERLRKLLGFADASPERKYVGARVVGIQLSPSGLQLLVIDRGTADGVERDRPVVTADGVVGRVHAATAHSAEVLTLIDRNSSIAVRVDRTRARANVRGLGVPGACRLDYALRSEDVADGDLLVTSGTDGIFPRGIPVGKVSDPKKTAGGLFQEGAVVPGVNVTRVEEVLVITAFEALAPEPVPAATTSPATTSPAAAPPAAAKGAPPAAPGAKKAP